MDIAVKIKDARQNANLSQEQVAEALGVSRQTISNWETGKTYPDIVSVIKMSDIYSISLDRLLKVDKPMSDYLEYLDESTNVVKSKNKLQITILICTYLLVWSISLIAFWFFIGPTDGMGYTLLYFWILLPLTTFIVSIFIGKNPQWGKSRWLWALFFGVMYMLAEYGTFSMSYMVYYNKVNMPDFSMILYGGVNSLLGIGIGAAMNGLRKRKDKQSGK